MIKSVIFDLDGTLINSLQDLANACNYALSLHDLAPHPEEKYRYFVGDGVQMLIQRILSPYGITDPDIIETIRQEYTDYYTSHPTDCTIPYLGVSQLLSELKNRGVKLGIVSNKPHYFSIQITHKIFGDQVFDLILGQRDDVPKKPNPQAVLEMLQVFDLTPEECLYLGDTNVDMQTAVNAGIRGIGVAWGFRTPEELWQNGAYAVIQEPCELLKYIQ